MKETISAMPNDFGKCHKTDCEYCKCGRCVAGYDTICDERWHAFMDGIGIDGEVEQ